MAEIFADRRNGKPRVRYVFGVGDTHLTQDRRARTPRLWSIRPEQHEAVSAALEDMFHSDEIAGLPFDEKIIRICELAVKNRFADCFAELKPARTDSLLEELDDLNLTVRFRQLLENSVAYTVLTRCGLDTGLYYEDVDFEYVYDFSTPAVISVLGRAVSDISRTLLLELGRLAGSVERGRTQRPDGKPAAAPPAPRPAQAETEGAEPADAPAPAAQSNTDNEAGAVQASAADFPQEETQASALQPKSPEPACPEPSQHVESKGKYRFSLGDTVYVGAKEYELLAYGDENVTLCDPEFPLFQEVMPRGEFDAKIAENPLNDHLLQVVEEPPVLDPAPVPEEPEEEAAAGQGRPSAGTDLELENAKQLINDYCMEEFEQEADFSDLNHVDLAFSSTSGSQHTVEVYADLIAYRLMYQVDGEVTASIQCHDCGEMCEYLANLDFDEMVAFAEEQYHQQQRQRQELETDDFSDIDPAAVRAALAENGIVDGHVVDPDKLAENPFIQQVMADARQMEQNAPTQEPAEQETLLPPPAPRRRSKIAPAVLHPEIPAADRHGYHITDDDIGTGTPGERYGSNVRAIRLLKKLEEEDRLATPEEQEVLARYVGWGGLADCFDERHSKYAELKALLTEDEYAAARASTLNAHYTTPTVIRAIYTALGNMGFTAGNILEPSCGIGNFFGCLPESMGASKLYGVELDSLTGRIARQLYQNASITVQGYEKTSFPRDFFDLAVGNVPFGRYQVSDKAYNHLGFSIHNYFFAKALD